MVVIGEAAMGIASSLVTVVSTHFYKVRVIAKVHSARNS